MLPTILFMSKFLGWMSWRRLNVSNCRVRAAARSAAWVICCADRDADSSSSADTNSEAWP